MRDASPDLKSRFKRAFEGWMFPVFEWRFTLPGHWPASTLSIGLGDEKGMWESRVVRDGEFANVITEMKYGSKFGLYLLGALMLIMIPFSMPSVPNPIFAFSFIPIYLSFGFLLRIRGSIAHGSAVGAARQLLRSKA